MSLSTQGNVFSWPIARITVSQGMTISSIFSEVNLPLSSWSHLSLAKRMPTNFPFSTTYSSGEWFRIKSMSSSKAGSSSQSEDFMRSLDPRYTTLTSLPPNLSEDRQQSMAVLPPPTITTLSPTLSICSNATDSNQAMPTKT